MNYLSKFLFLASMAMAVPLFMMPMAAIADEGGVPAESVDVVEPAAVTSGSAVLLRARFVTDDTLSAITTSTTFVQVPNMTTTFTTARGGVFVITFSAYSYAALDELMYVAAQVNGVNASPGEIQWTGDSDEDLDNGWARARSFTWISSGYPPGTHTVRIMFRSRGGGTVHMHKRSLLVQSSG